VDINKVLPIGSANGLAYVNDGYGAILKMQFVKRLYKDTTVSKDGSEEE